MGGKICIAISKMTWTYDRAENGNVALIGEIDLHGAGDTFILALGFGLNDAEAGYRALASLYKGFDSARAAYIDEWQQWQQGLMDLDKSDAGEMSLYRVSTVVMRTHGAKRFRGGLMASLSIPWGFSKGDDDLGGYHLVWPRDLVEIGGGLLAAGALDEAGSILEYLRVTQELDGHWPQNMWINGTPYWTGVQMDETAFPILLVDQARREKALHRDLDHYWPMVRRAAGYLVCNGPVTQQDRWEEDPGYSPFTLAVEIAALLAAADLAELQGDETAAAYLRETADSWNDSVEKWTYATGTDLAQEADVEGYYVRIAPPEEAAAGSPAEGFVPIKNRPPGQSAEAATQIVSPDALALVRFGLRGPDTAEITNTVKVIDQLLKVETPTGPAWHRYNDDGYGEHEDGAPFDGTGTGRAWPLLTGERAHYELAAGRKDEAERLLNVLASFASSGGMLPEQVWDAPDIPERGLAFGRPSGSAMPLAWAHAEYVKLCHSLKDGRVFDMPPQTVQRYQIDETHSPRSIWRFNNKSRVITAGLMLRVEVLSPAEVQWSSDGWKTVRKVATQDTGLGIYFADLPADQLAAGDTIAFRFLWNDKQNEQSSTFTVQVVDSTKGSESKLLAADQ